MTDICPLCGNKMTVLQDELLGKDMRCPFCEYEKSVNYYHKSVTERIYKYA